jgi:hypothetical protein
MASACGDSSRSLAVKLRPGLGKPGLRQRDNGFLLAAMGKPHHRLADGNDLAWLRKRCRDHTIGIGLKL